jgi:superfamily I DNA and/or RNA helicase
MRMLGVHYRSRHQSLIAYSNREFYDDRLLVYPSPVLDDPDFGVTRQKVPDGEYEAGQGRNPVEARAIVSEAATLMRRRIDRSIGIVAVNKAQSELIESLMDELAASNARACSGSLRQACCGLVQEEAALQARCAKHR